MTLGSLGIATVGRSFRLRVNYRSTEEILAWSARLLAPVTVDALEGEGTDSLAGYRSLLHGSRPRVRGYATRQEETEALVERVRTLLTEGLAPHEIGVCARFNLALDTAEEKLKAAGIPVLRVKGQVAQGSEGVRLATMHAMKGLEFRRCPCSVSPRALSRSPVRSPHVRRTRSSTMPTCSVSAVCSSSPAPGLARP